MNMLTRVLFAKLQRKGRAQRERERSIFPRQSMAHVNVLYFSLWNCCRRRSATYFRSIGNQLDASKPLLTTFNCPDHLSCLSYIKTDGELINLSNIERCAGYPGKGVCMFNRFKRVQFLFCMVVNRKFTFS